MRIIESPKSLQAFVKDIYVIRGDDADQSYSYPFYADGFPGIIYAKSENPFYYMPAHIKLSDFYLYGQTLKPISLDTKGRFHLIGIRLYPFVARILLGVNPKKLNDSCFDLLDVKGVDTLGTLEELKQTESESDFVRILEHYFHKLLSNKNIESDHRIQMAINLILQSHGKVTIKAIREQLYISERSFERKFVKEIGITPKQFAKLIQFDASLQQLSSEDYYKLTEVGVDNGYADQSHFIRVFKSFTGKTPKEFQLSGVL